MPAISQELREQMVVSAFFASPAWAAFEKKLKDLQACASSNVNELIKSHVTDSNLSRFNFFIAERNAYDKVMAIKAEMLEDVDLLKEQED